MAHILIVDDDADIRQSMRIILEEIGGHTVVEAEDGSAGLDVLRASNVRLIVVLDRLMPGLDGFDVLQAVVAEKELATRHAYILATGSHKDPHELLQGAPLAVTIMSKPFGLDDLLAVVSRAAAALDGE